MEAAIIVSWRCPLHCKMCSIWQYPSDPKEEFNPSLLGKLPYLYAVNVTGGEPFEREDLSAIVRILLQKARRVVISTNGWHTERILALSRKFPEVGFRISLEGLRETNDRLRGVPGGFDQAMKTLCGLRKAGCRDLGIAMTLSGTNSGDLLPLYRLSREMGLEFATAAVHNSFYFHKQDNRIQDAEPVATALDELVRCQLKEKSPKSWARAWFNRMLRDHILGAPRPLPCGGGSHFFFLDPQGRVLPCNGSRDALSMGDLGTASSFDELWRSARAREVRKKLAACGRNCWMIGSVSPAIRRHPLKVCLWILRAQFHRLFGGQSGADRSRKGGER